MRAAMTWYKSSAEFSEISRVASRCAAVLGNATFGSAAWSTALGGLVATGRSAREVAVLTRSFPNSARKGRDLGLEDMGFWAD